MTAWEGLGGDEGEGGATWVPGDLRSLLVELSRGLSADLLDDSSPDRAMDYRDEDSLVHSGFRPTLTGQGWEGVDKKGIGWLVYPSRIAGRSGLMWYKQLASGATERYGTMKFNEYKQLFDNCDE